MRLCHWIPLSWHRLCSVRLGSNHPESLTWFVALCEELIKRGTNRTGGRGRAGWWGSPLVGFAYEHRSQETITPQDEMIFYTTEDCKDPDDENDLLRNQHQSDSKLKSDWGRDLGLSLPGSPAHSPGLYFTTYGTVCMYCMYSSVRHYTGSSRESRVRGGGGGSWYDTVTVDTIVQYDTYRSPVICFPLSWLCVISLILAWWWRSQTTLLS